jgi:hypothetical protein
VRASIAEHAPLSLLALAEGVEPIPDLQLVHNAFSWLTKRHGRQKALEWRKDTYLRGIVFRGLRRELGASGYTAEMRRVLQEEVIIRQDGKKLVASIGHLLPPLPAKDSDAFARVVTSFELAPAITNRTSENAMRIAALRVAASKPRGKATTTELKNEVDQYVILTAEDRLPSKTRPNEAMYQQIVGNIVSHRGSRNNIFAKGWALYTGDGIEITDAGRKYLRTFGDR